MVVKHLHCTIAEVAASLRDSQVSQKHLLRCLAMRHFADGRAKAGTKDRFDPGRRAQIFLFGRTQD